MGINQVRLEILNGVKLLPFTQFGAGHLRQHHTPVRSAELTGKFKGEVQGCGVGFSGEWGSVSAFGSASGATGNIPESSRTIKSA